jgi:hypothetical protein
MARIDWAVVADVAVLDRHARLCMRGAWIESSFDVEGQHVGVSVRRLDDDERRRMAAEIAWFAEGLLTPGVDLGSTGWPALLDTILSHSVAITLDEDRADDAVDFWNQVICRTFDAFVKANQLYPVLENHLGAGLTPR